MPTCHTWDYEHGIAHVYSLPIRAAAQTIEICLTMKYFTFVGEYCCIDLLTFLRKPFGTTTVASQPMCGERL